MSNGKQRRHFTGQEKVAMLWRHLVEKVPVSDLCQEQGTHPTFFNRYSSMSWSEGP
jgi:hypothetical protein